MSGSFTQQEVVNVVDFKRTQSVDDWNMSFVRCRYSVLQNVNASFTDTII